MIDCIAKTNWASNIPMVGGEKIRSAQTDMNGSRIVLLDTPGFGDHTPSDIVNQIESWLSSNLGPNPARLSGILYLHSISEHCTTRVSPAILQRLLESEDAFKVIIVTSMWNKVRRREIAERRERELHTSYWKELLDLGANTDRFDDEEETARRIVNHLLGT